MQECLFLYPAFYPFGSHNTVWKLLEFILTHYWKNFRENNVIIKLQCGNFRNFLSRKFYVKSVLEISEVQILLCKRHLEALNFDFWTFLHYLKTEIHRINKIQSLKIGKKAVLELLIVQNLSDRKILKFPLPHTV